MSSIHLGKRLTSVSFSEPEWTSYSLGVFLCVDCCGVHRNLGTHLSKVKGIKLDNWDSEQVEVRSNQLF